jgi:hypothetical protein
MCLTRSSLKAIAVMLPDVLVAMLPNSADANSGIGGLMLIPDITGTSEMPTASKKWEGLWQYFRPS